MAGWVAQSVEHCTENAGVGGSSPPPTTPENPGKLSVSRGFISLRPCDECDSRETNKRRGKFSLTPIGQPVITKLLLFGVFASTVLCTSLVTFGLYWWDKRASKRNAERISERTLHIWAVIGGWPGALYAREKFRHKTQKQPFGLILWGTVAGNLLAWLIIGWFLS